MRQKLYSIGAGCALLFLATAAQAQISWSGMDLAGPADPGTFTDNGGGNFTITGGGDDIWGTRDQCYYYWAWASGSQWVATVQCTDLQGPDNWSKAELMVRWSDPVLGPQANDGFIAAMTTRSGGQNQTGPQYRPTRGAGAGNTVGVTGVPTYPNQWLRLARTNNIFTISFSSDGVTFDTISTIDTSNGAVGGFGTPWPDAVTVGVAVTAHNNAGGGTIATAMFSGLTVTFPPITAPTLIGASVQVTNSSAYAGSEASFSFQATNNAVPNVVGASYQWYKNGAVIPNATGLSYTHLVNPFDATEDGDEYSCIATIQPPYNTTVSSLNSSTGTLSVIPGAVYYTNGLKEEFFANATGRTAVENGNVPKATRLDRLATLDSSGGMGNNYVTRNSGWWIPPATDDYVFFMATDDDSDLYLSLTGMDPATKQLIAQAPGWSPTRSWLIDGGGLPASQQRSDQWTPDGGATVPGALGYHLTAGTPYYIELVHNQGGGGDNYGVTYQTMSQILDPNWTIDFTNGIPSLMTSGLVLITTPTTTLTWSLQPTNTTVNEGFSGTLYAQAVTDSELRPRYQWYRNGAPVAGATSASFGTGTTISANDGDTFYVVATTQEGGLSITSSPPATLSVIQSIFETGFAQVKFWSGAASRAAIYDGSAGTPTYITTSPRFEAGVNGESGDNYSRQVSGFFIPPTTDDYVFFTCSDDDSDLWLSTDSTRANVRLIAQETGWSGQFNWTGVGAGTVTEKRSDSWIGTNSGALYINGIHLIAGTKYYMEVDQHEGGGGDNVEVTYKRYNDPDPVVGSDSIIMGNVLGTYAIRCGWVNFTQQPTNPPPVNSATAGTVSFYADGTTDSQTPVGVTGDPRPFVANGWPYLTFQWQKNGVDIPGATTGTLTLSSPFLPSDNGAVISCRMRALGLADDSLNPIWSNSLPATLTVITNTPHLVYSSVYTNVNWVVFTGLEQTWVTLAFDSPMDPGLLSQPSTYTLGGGLTIVSVTVNSNDFRSVVLEVSGTPSLPFTVAINPAVSGLGGGAPVANTSVPVNTVPLLNKDIGLTPTVDPGYPGWMVPQGTNAYTISAEGSDIWANDDGFNFSYEMKTGDFDVAVRQKDIKHTSNWAKGGLMVRETLDSYSRNWNIINDPLASDGIQAPDGSGMGASLVECNRRNATFGASDGWGLIGTQPAPAYPNAWVRLKRTGDLLSAFYSANGQNWTLLATNNPTTVGDSNALPATVYVGLCVTAHNNDPAFTPFAQLQYLNVVNFADYDSNYVPPVITPQPVMTVTPSGNNIIISWSPATGTLQASPALVGAGVDWQPVAGASPVTVPIAPGNRYFRVAP